MRSVLAVLHNQKAFRYAHIFVFLALTYPVSKTACWYWYWYWSCACVFLVFQRLGLTVCKYSAHQFVICYKSLIWLVFALKASPFFIFQEVWFVSLINYYPRVSFARWATQLLAWRKHKDIFLISNIDSFHIILFAFAPQVRVPSRILECSCICCRRPRDANF